MTTTLGYEYSLETQTVYTPSNSTVKFGTFISKFRNIY